jgi:hypothetical protein
MVDIAYIWEWSLEAMRSVWVILLWLFALILGFALATYGFWVSSQWNSTMVISDIRAKSEVSMIGHQRLLKVEFHMSGGQQCPSWTQHTLYRDMAVTLLPKGDKETSHIERTVVPLGITVNGFGAPSDRTEFALPFILPVSVTAGAWNYAAITSVSCEYLPGLTRQRFQETSPVSVFVAGPA